MHLSPVTLCAEADRLEREAVTNRDRAARASPTAAVAHLGLAKRLEERAAALRRRAAPHRCANCGETIEQLNGRPRLHCVECAPHAAKVTAARAAEAVLEAIRTRKAAQ